MTIQQIADRLHELVKIGDSNTAYDELFASHAVAIEPQFKGFERVEGLDNIRKKVNAILEAVAEVKSREVSEAVLYGDRHIALGISLDATLKDGSTFKFSELALYEVQEGKIISEQFYY